MIGHYLATMQQNMQNLAISLADSKAEISMLKASLKTAECPQLDALKAEIAALKPEALKAEITAFKTVELDALKAQIVALKTVDPSQLEALKAEIAALKTVELDALKTQIAALKPDALKAEIAALKTVELDTLKAEIATVRTEMVDLRKQLDDKLLLIDDVNKSLESIFVPENPIDDIIMVPKKESKKKGSK